MCFLGYIKSPNENEIVLISIKECSYHDMIRYAYYIMYKLTNYKLFNVNTNQYLNFDIKGGNIYYNGTNQKYDLLTGLKLPFLNKYLKYHYHQGNISYYNLYIILYIYYILIKLPHSFNSYMKVLSDIVFMYYPRLK
jgi:hypothetical protein